MRPINLKLKAFASYAGENVIDIRKLDGRKFFLIHGPTGSGKTSILDGICFALYGDTSGESRKGSQMRSDHSKPDMLTEVTFDFSIGSDKYRIIRSPEQDRPKIRGYGVTTEPPKATLWKRTGLDDDLKEGDVIAAQYSEVTKKIESLLGFSSDQFRQVIMLPQGKFRKFLESKSDAREEILEILFRTETYRKIQEALKNKAKEIEEKRKNVQNHRDILLDNAEVSSVDELEEQKAAVEIKSKKMHAEVGNLRKKEAKTQKALNDGNRVVELFREMGDARTAFKKIEAETEEYEKKRKKLKQARKALPLIEIESELEQRRSESSEAENNFKQAKEKLLNARKAHKEALRNLKKEKDREPEQEKLSKRINQLEDLKTEVNKLFESRKALDDAQKDENKLTKEGEALNKNLDDCRKKLEETRKAVNEAEKETAKLEGLKTAVTEAESNYKKRTQLYQLGKDLNETRKEHAQVKSAFDQINKKLNTERKALAAMEGVWTKCQANVLAQKLETDKPCPVCGSTKHPAPARYDEKLPKEKEIDDKRKLVNTLQDNREKKQKAETEARSKVTELEIKTSTLKEDLGDLSDEEISVLESKLFEAEEAKQKAERAEQSVVTLSEEIGELETKETQLKQRLTENEKQLKNAVEVRLKLNGIVEDLEARVQEEFQYPKAVDKEIDSTKKSMKSLKESLEGAQKKSENASKKLSASESILKEASLTQEKAVKQEKAVSDRFNAEIKKSGFKDASEYRTIRLDPESIDELDLEIKSYDGSFEAAKERLKRARDATKGLKIPDIEKLEKIANEVKTAHEMLVREESKLNEQLKQIKKWSNGLKGIANDLELLDREYALMGRISEVANGKNPLKITFQRFVLATMLDNVLVVASKRFKVMSKGRFQLHREIGQKDRRSSGGLDLEVFDAYTGKMRPVSTLSGGEGFQASLSLALGLADVVQSYTGGLYMDTLFVDEGFGSLDSEALDLAVQTLRDLQTGGRMVAIISHVSELKERISARLEVEPSRTGSSTQFVIG